MTRIKELQEKLATLPQSEKYALLKRMKEARSSKATEKHNSTMAFSLFFFSDNGSQNNKAKYQLLMDCARYADQNGFQALWTPERHFNEFGGPYPNPSLLAAAMAGITENIQLRAGSVVLPLHHPMRVAEEWSVVDNLSEGRIGIACASGWHPNDFIFSHQSYEDRFSVFIDSIQKIKKLWSGEQVAFSRIGNNPVSVELFPKPVSKTLPMWMTSAGNPKLWIKAGEMGLNILSGLMEQSIEELDEKIKLYRESLKKSGFDPQKKQVTVMLHTFIGSSNQEVEKIVKKPMMAYLKNHMKMYEKHIRAQKDLKGFNPDSITEKDKETLLELGFQRYFYKNALMGDLDKNYQMVKRLSDIGVDEIACLVNFGAKDGEILHSLEGLSQLNRKCKELFSNET